MILSELLVRSPIRILEQSIHGGLKSGEIGIIASEHGVGKTSVLVQLALDKLLQGKKVIHVSFSNQRLEFAHHVISWYEDIFDEFISKKNLENAVEIKNELVKNRVLMNFNQDVMSIDQIIAGLRAMIVEGGFKADALIIDGFDFSRTDNERIAHVKAFAQELGLSVWYSCSIPDEDSHQGNVHHDRENIPVILNDFSGLIDVLIMLKPKHDHIELSVSKDRDAHIGSALAMRLDPRTLLILEN